MRWGIAEAPVLAENYGVIAPRLYAVPLPPTAFLTAQTRRGVAASTQNPVFNALVFFEVVLKTPLEDIDAMTQKSVPTQ